MRWTMLLLILTAGGCSRKHFRERADSEVSNIMAQKDVFPDWKLENWHVYPDARARFADPSKPDNTPYPADDYPAWLLSPNPQRPNTKSGTGRFEGDDYLNWIERWDGENRAKDEPVLRTTETKLAPDITPSYVTALKSEAKTFRITVDQSVELAIFNSREFQDRREDLYNSALPVTEQRFSFAAQMFAGTQAARVWSGDRRTDPGNRWNIATESTVSRLFPTGGTLLVRFANEIVLDLTSNRPDINLSGLSLTFIQPFLMGGGYAVTLEGLTQAERTLLYAMRSYARYRKVFYTAITVAGDYTNNPYGLAGLSVNLGRGIGVNFTAPSVGYLPTALRAATLTNEKKNIQALEQNLKLINNLKEGGNSTQLQVIQAEQQLLTSLSDFLTNTRLYQDQIDNFKLQLGVPTTLPLELDDAPLRPMKKQMQTYDELYAQLDRFQTDAAVFEADDTDESVRARWRKLLTESPLGRETPFAKQYPEFSERLRLLPAVALKLRGTELVAERQKLLDLRTDRQLAGKVDTPQQEEELAMVETAIDFVRFEEALRVYATRPWLRLPKERQLIEQQQYYRGVSDAGTLLGIRERNQRNDAIRAAWPDLPGVIVCERDLVEGPLDEALVLGAQTALEKRLDLMNTRAQVVDAYRQIAVRANALQGVFDLRYNHDSGPLTGASSGIGPTSSRNTLTLRFEPPLVRRVERNLYRAALIAYQRQRRFLQATEDNIVNDVRADIRQLRALGESYKLQARAVELAYAQVDSARSTLVAPPDPGARESAGNIAALTDQLLRAQAQLLRSQNALYTVWINYQVARTTTYLDLELLPLDSRGLWNTMNLSSPPLNPPLHLPAPLEEPENPGADAPGSPTKNTDRKRPKKRKRWPLLLAFAGGILVLGGAAAVWSPFAATARADLLWTTAKIEELPVAVVEKGQLESIDNRDIVCHVKAGSKGTFASTIKWVIDDGSLVNKGQLLIELDDSALQENYKSQSITVEKAKAEWEKAHEEYTITTKQNEADSAQALANLRVAELDLDKFLGFREDLNLAPMGALLGGVGVLAEKGEYRSQLDDVSGRLKQAESDLDAYRERAAWAERSVKLGYLTPSQARVEATKMSGGQDSVEKLRKEKYILENFTRERTLTDLKAKVDVARIGLERAQFQARSKEVQAESDRRTKRSVLDREEERLQEIEEQIGACKIYAPQAGMVVYTKPESSRYSANSQGMIAQGEQVKEGQKLMRIPDLRKMQVNTKVHEALVAKIKGDDRRSTGVLEALRSGMLLNPDRFSRLVMQAEHVQSQVREQVRDKEYYTAEQGQRATVRVDAFPDRTFSGRVRSVAAVASSIDFMSDVKTYQTLVMIEETVDGLRPDMNAEVTIHIEDTLEPVVAVPVSAIVGGAEGGSDRAVYVKTLAGPVERKVKLGKFNDKMIEVREGLVEGEEVLTNPKVFLGDKAKTGEDLGAAPKAKGGGPGGGKKGEGKKGTAPKKAPTP